MPRRKAAVYGVRHAGAGGAWRWCVRRPVFGFAHDTEYHHFDTWRQAMDWLAGTYRLASGSASVERTTRPVADRCWDGWQMEIR